MPRKFKISFSGCESDCAQGLLHDLAVIATRKDGAPAPEVDACQILLAKVSDPRSPVPGLPGDLLLTHYGEDGKPVVRRFLRKMSGPGE